MVRIATSSDDSRRHFRRRRMPNCPPSQRVRRGNQRKCREDAGRGVAEILAASQEGQSAEVRENEDDSGCEEGDLNHAARPQTQAKSQR